VSGDKKTGGAGSRKNRHQIISTTEDGSHRRIVQSKFRHVKFVWLGKLTDAQIDDFVGEKSGNWNPR
jgi:hypothetical protein